MQISPISYSKKSFKAANISINALSDTHGELLLANNVVEEMRQKPDKFFFSNQKGNANFVTVCGDWFINGGKKGFKSSPNKPLAFFQLPVLNEFISQIKGISRNAQAFFLPGNHEFDGGVDLLDDVLSKIDADIIASNIDIEHSHGFSKTIALNKLFNEKVVEVEDDKDPNLKHKLMFLGVMPINLKMYQKNLKGIKLSDVNSKPLAQVKKEDYRQTLDICKSKIEAFKKDNPAGIVVFMSHAGADFADNLAAEAPIDIVFDGHEHKTKTRFVGNTVIIPLSQNFERIVNTKMHINDNGVLNLIETQVYRPQKNAQKGPLYKLYRALFRKDLEKCYRIQAQNPNVSSLDVEGVREGNNFLANFVTDSILEELKKEDSSIDVFALNASAIRHSLPISDTKEISMLDVNNVLAGINEDVSGIYTNEVNGLKLAYLVRDNILFNRYNPQKNPLMQYSGLIIDRGAILNAIDKKKTLSKYLQYIKDAKTNEPIEADKNYKIANVDKYFIKSNNTTIRKMKNSAKYTGFNVHQLFKRHFSDSTGSLIAKCDVRI